MVFRVEGARLGLDAHVDGVGGHGETPLGILYLRTTSQECETVSRRART